MFYSKQAVVNCTIKLANIRFNTNITTDSAIIIYKFLQQYNVKTSIETLCSLNDKDIVYLETPDNHYFVKVNAHIVKGIKAYRLQYLNKIDYKYNKRKL